MRIKPFLIMLGIWVLAVVPGQGADLQVVSASPQGEGAASGRQAVSVTFNQPVAALAESSAFASGACPLQITPAVSGTCRFSGTQTLQFEPEAAWPAATEYTVTLPGSFSSRVSGQTLGEAYQFSFATQRPEVQEVTPSNGEQWIDVRPLVFVTVSQPVNLASARQAAALSYDTAQEPGWWERLKAYALGGTAPAAQVRLSVPVTVRALTEKEHEAQFSYLPKDRIFVVIPQQDLPTGTPITLTVSSALRGQEGTLGPQQDFTSVFYTYPALRQVGGNLEGCLPFDAHLDFSSPVRLGDLLKHLTVSPTAALAEVTEPEAQTLGYQRYVPADGADTQDEEPAVSHPVDLPPGTGYFALPLSFLRLQPHQTVTLTVDKNLTDIYGQKLGESKTFTVRNSGYCPAAVFKGGTGVLESYLPARHPIDVLNAPELEVEAGRFDKETFIPFREQDTNYCQPAEIAQAALQYDGAYAFASVPDKTQKTYLDLKKFNSTSHQSIIYSQVRVPSTQRAEGYCWVGATDNITDLGVTLKTSQDNVLVWVTSLQTGQPQANLSVELKDQFNRTLWTGSTDADGLAKAPGLRQLAPSAKNRWSRPVVYVFVSSSGGDAVLASDWNDGIEPWRFHLNFDYFPSASQLKTALFTDRGVYRPGETVYLKGITRALKNGVWTLPAASTGQLKLYNARGDEAFSQTVHFTPGTGAFDLSIPLPADAATGLWQAYFKPAGTEEDDTTYSFRVEAVKQADFKVQLRALEPAYTSAEKAEFTASADYLFGAPVSGGKAKWTVRRAAEPFRPEGYDEYMFTPYFLTRDENQQDSLLLQSSGQLDAQGKLNFTVPLPTVTSRQSVYAEVGVQAPTGQQLFARTRVALNPAEFYLGAYRDRWAAEAGDEIVTKLVAVNSDGTAAGPVTVQAHLEKEEYFSIRKNGLAGRLEWVSERRVQDLGTRRITVGKDGADFAFTAAKPGTYQVTLSAKDSRGRTVRGGFEVMVYGAGEAYWKQHDDDILPLQADKSLYAPGDTARILVQSPYAQATALVTVERGGVLDGWVTDVSSGADYIDVPVKASYTPNAFVSVTLVRGRAEKPSYDKEGLDLAKPQGKTGYAVFKISQQEREINTQVTTGKAQYLPGEEVTVKLSTSVRGAPAAADVTVMAVDDGVLALTGYKMPDLMQVFYADQPLSVFTADNRLFLIGQRNFGEKGENRGGGGGLDGKLGGADLRSHFEFTPYFNGRVHTNDKGRAELKFKLPDNLTTFRIMAVAATVKEFGAGETSVQVSKPLMLTPKMPRFARRGDHFRCGAVVYNYEDEKGQITVSARASGALKLTGEAQTVQVAKGAAQEVSWPCETLQTGPAQVTFSAKGNKTEDSVLSTLSVSEVEQAQTLALYSATDSTQEQLLEKPASADPQADNAVALSLASTALLNVRGGMLYLLTYPYDCLEQKMSKILPVVEGASLAQDFGLGDTSTYKKQTQEILNQLGTYQAPSGGLAYWPGAQADAYVTAYALETAHRARQAGYTVPQAVLQKAVTWLKGLFGGKLLQAYPYSVQEENTARAYAVYVLALYGEKLDSAFTNLYTKRNALSVPAQAYLLLAAQALNKGADIRQNLAQALLNQAQYGAQTLHFSAGAAQPWLHMEDVKVTALTLEALLRAGDFLAQPYQVVRWLSEQLGPQGHWNNTSANAAVFSALHTYYTLRETDVPDFKTSVSLDGKNVLSARFQGRSLAARQAVWPFAQVYSAGPQARVNLAKSGPGTVYYTLTQTYTPAHYTEALNAGFEVSRRITDLQGKAVSSFRAGERYKVTLQVRSAASRSFVVLEDFLPAGFEVVNTSLATESQSDAGTLPNSDGGGFERDEKYDDRVAVFADYLAAGTHEYSYLVQAAVPGEFSYPSLWASQMYEPAVFGRGATSRLVIEP